MYTTIRKHIILARKSKNMSQAQMAESLHISQSAYAQIESGKTKLDLERFFSIAALLDINLCELSSLINTNNSFDTKHTTDVYQRISRLERAMEMFIKRGGGDLIRKRFLKACA